MLTSALHAITEYYPTSFLDFSPVAASLAYMLTMEGLLLKHDIFIFKYRIMPEYHN